MHVHSMTHTFFTRLPDILQETDFANIISRPHIQSGPPVCRSAKFPRCFFHEYLNLISM